MYGRSKFTKISKQEKLWYTKKIAYKHLLFTEACCTGIIQWLNKLIILKLKLLLLSPKNVFLRSFSSTLRFSTTVREFSTGLCSAWWRRWFANASQSSFTPCLFFSSDLRWNNERNARLQIAQCHRRLCRDTLWCRGRRSVVDDQCRTRSIIAGNGAATACRRCGRNWQEKTGVSRPRKISSWKPKDIKYWLFTNKQTHTSFTCI